ncbi:hypothetical protein ACG83_41095 [Frankia sp. R43]|uniref:hypothetical protein n=1 Tax=Frankia sp. R43 TaxID=269536 RepID=UPI0006CA07CA|nr:hypothetical protein [Frankia sp. R43]KPM50279.1 hypothetical protein ACG83_41095 [Frankia sp. R43]
MRRTAPRATPQTDPDATPAGALTIAGVTVRITQAPSHPIMVSIDTGTPGQDDPTDLAVLLGETRIFEHWRADAATITPEGVTTGALTVGGVKVAIEWDPVHAATVVIDSGSDALDLYVRGEMIFEGLQWDFDLLASPPVVSYGTTPTPKADGERGIRQILRRFRHR